MKIGDKVSLCWNDGILKSGLKIEDIDKEENLIWVEGESFGFDLDSKKQIDFDDNYYIQLD